MLREVRARTWGINCYSLYVFLIRWALSDLSMGSGWRDGVLVRWLSHPGIGGDGALVLAGES